MELIHYAPSESRSLATPWKAGLCIMTTCKVRYHNQLWVPLPFLFLSIYSLAQHHMVNIPLVSLGQLFWLWTSRSVAYPQPTHWFVGRGKEKEGGGRKELTICKHCSATAKTLVWYQYHFSHKCKAKHQTECYEGSWFYPSQTGLEVAVILNQWRNWSFQNMGEIYISSIGTWQSKEKNKSSTQEEKKQLGSVATSVS